MDQTIIHLVKVSHAHQPSTLLDTIYIQCVQTVSILVEGFVCHELAQGLVNESINSANIKQYVIASR